MPKKEKTFSRTFQDALLKAEIIREMAIADGWRGIDDCLKEAPQALDILVRHADAAVHALRKMEKRKVR